MTQDTQPTFELTLGEVSLKAPETPLYLALAVQVLEVRRQELQERGVGTPSSPKPSAVSVDTSPQIQGVTSSVTQPVVEQTPASTQQVTSPVTQPAAAPAPAPVTAPTPPARRARWFHDQFPQITYEDGSTQVIPSLDALKELLKNRGLQPHPRGDASMLLWQVRNRLGLTVDRVENA